MEIQPFDESKLESIIQLALRAWKPVYASIEKTMDPEVYVEQVPDWRNTQRQAVESVCAETPKQVWVATEGTKTLGFMTLKLHPEEKMGEIYMIAVDPNFQRRGIGRALTQHALACLKERGMTTVMVDTGGDSGHAPARRTYEAAGFKAFPIARYFKKL